MTNRLFRATPLTASVLAAWTALAGSAAADAYSKVKPPANFDFQIEALVQFPPCPRGFQPTYASADAFVCGVKAPAEALAAYAATASGASCIYPWWNGGASVHVNDTDAAPSVRWTCTHY